jgi:hypothetical protein
MKPPAKSTDLFRPRKASKIKDITDKPMESHKKVL